MSSSFCRSDDWPRYGGPRQDGISLEKNWVTQWLQQGPKIAWTAAVGTGFSAVSISRGKAYTMGNTGDTDTVYCFDADTGATVWKYSYPCPCQPIQYEGGPNSTPTVDGDRVYTLSRVGHLFCLDANTGKVIWAKEARRDFGGVQPRWGYAGSPLIVGDLVIIDMGGNGASTVALNKATGATVWSAGNDKAAYASPVAFKFGQYSYVASFNASGLVFLSVTDGKEVSRIPWKTAYDVNAATPLFTPDNKVFISSGYGVGCALVQLSTKPPEVLWTNTNMRAQFNTCVIWEGHIYGFDESSQLRCLDLKTGMQKWVQGGLGKGSLIAANGKLIILSEGGMLVIAEASPTAFTPLSRAQILTGRCWTVPVLANGRLYARNAAGNLVCVDLRGN